MHEFFEFPPTRSNRVKWALLELGIDYESRLVDFRSGEQRSDAYREIHPLGHVPAYRTADYTMQESVAIVMQLIDEHPGSGLAPEIGTPQRAAYYQWCVLCCAELDHVLNDVMKHTMHFAEEDRVPEIAARGREKFSAAAAMISSVLAERTYLLGTDFSGADVCFGYCCNWAAYTGMLDSNPNLVRYYARLQARPAFQTVFSS